MVPNSETLTPNQAARRDRVLDAALVLAAEGGYDAVQMRDVATRAQVALGTIYRYFASKDHLLAECQLELWRDLVEHLENRPLRGDTPAERVTTLLRRAMRAAEIEPQRTAALVTASATPDPAVRECQVEIMELMDAALSAAMGDELDEAEKERVATTLRHVWFAALTGWVNGWSDQASVVEDLDAATHLLLD